MIPQTNSRLAIVALFLTLLCGIFTFELATVVQWLLARKRERQSTATLFRYLIAPVSVGLFFSILIPIVFVGKIHEIPGTETAIRCDDTAVDGDVGGDGIRIAVWAQESVLLLIAMLGTFHCATTGAKEIGAGLVITHISLAIAVLVQANRGALKSTEAILGAMVLDSQNSALSIQLVAKETLASRWQVMIVVSCQVFGLAVVAVLVSRFSSGVYAVQNCECIAVFWWGWLSDCLAFPTRELAIWWTYYASRCLTTVQCAYHAASSTANFHQAEKFGLRLKTIPMAYPKAEGVLRRSAQESDEGWSQYATCPSTITFMYIVYGVYALTSMAAAETTMRDFGIQPSSDVFSVGQIVALVVACATILRACWLLAGLFLQTDDAGIGFVWPFLFASIRSIVGNRPADVYPLAPEPSLQQERLENDEREVACGPLLNFRRMEGTRWFGSVLVVTKGGGKSQLFTPALRLSKAERADSGPRCESDSRNTDDTVHGTRLYSDPRYTFWVFNLVVDMDETEAKWEYTFLDLQFIRHKKDHTYGFFVPARTESMRVMFYSCNGFNVGTNEDFWRGPALWNDVLRRHAEAPFHVMIGGGNQIYNDGIRVVGPMRPWTDISTTKKRREFPFPSNLRDEVDDFYLKSYIRWYTTRPFASVNCQVAQINIWDDREIIRGYGSYSDEFMACDIFRGMGSIAFKYYMLFQHHQSPPPFTYATDYVYNMVPPPGNSSAVDEEQQLGNHPEREFVAPRGVEPSYILGGRPGPYISERSHSIYARLGARIAFLGIDTRTERMKHQINFPDTYDEIFKRLNGELELATRSGTPIKHLLLLLSPPLAFPRLAGVERILASPFMSPISYLSRKLRIGASLFNRFDASPSLLPSVDNYTARAHKKEREDLVNRLQEVASAHSVRIMLLSGNVSMAAVSRFYASPDLCIPAEHDFRYMVNVVSSPIVNKPQPQWIANFVAGRNKIQYFDADTDETLLSLFGKVPGADGDSKNKVTMASRNYAVIAENSPNNPDATPAPASDRPARARLLGCGGHDFLHAGELNAGSKHKAAGEEHSKGNDGSLDVCFFVEAHVGDVDGHTEGYGLTVPCLTYPPPTATAHGE